MGIRTGTMVSRTAAVIIEPHLRAREALETLMTAHSYDVVRGVGSTDEIDDPSTVGNGLVILGARSVDQAVIDAADIRKACPDSRIVLLVERTSQADLQRLLASQVDGCVPALASPDTLIGALDLIARGEGRVMVTTDDRQQAGRADRTRTGRPAALEPPGALPARRFPKLSEREAQILDGLVKGHANKVIARTCAITEATVKVHMKSILRKIQVANRTQAAIWALEHGYPADYFKARLPKDAATTKASSISIR